MMRTCPLLLALLGPALGDTGGDTVAASEPVALQDADGDGWDVESGDCDDADATSHPGAPEVCGDHADNDCDGFVDQGCTDVKRFATLQGGGCRAAGPAGAATLAASLLLALGRRRRPPGCR